VLASSKASSDQIRASVDSMTSFIRQRSGYEPDPGFSDRLTRMEERTLTGQCRRISTDELGILLTGLAIERIRNGSDAEIEQVAEGFANIETIGPVGQQQVAASVQASSTKGDAQRDLIMLRFNGWGIMTTKEFVKEAKALRASLQSPVLAVAPTALMCRFGTELISARVESFADALPQQWGRSSREGLTPVQAFLAVYSVASDDPLWYSNAQLRQTMMRTEAHLRQAAGVAASSEGRTAFGSGGYIFSTPLDLALDPNSTARILDLIEERTAI
jgi:hypothetical protein